MWGIFYRESSESRPLTLGRKQRGDLAYARAEPATRLGREVLRRGPQIRQEARVGGLRRPRVRRGAGTAARVMIVLLGIEIQKR